MRVLLIGMATALLSISSLAMADSDTLSAETIDASDPTRVYTFAGAGFKYSDYTNGDSMSELRATGNIGLSPSDMVLFELGFGFHQGDEAPEGKDEGLTNGRLRYFHLFEMNYEKMGYRGMAAQVDLQIAGALKGTDGQNVIALGGLGAWGFSETLNFYAGPVIPSSWDKNFEQYNGTGLGVTALLVYTPDLWKGCYFQLWPSYSYFLNESLKDQGSGNLDLVAGGSFTDTLTWNITFQKNVDVDLNTYRRGVNTGLQNDWNLFASMTTYF